MEHERGWNEPWLHILFTITAATLLYTSCSSQHGTFPPAPNNTTPHALAGAPLPEEHTLIAAQNAPPSMVEVNSVPSRTMTFRANDVQAVQWKLTP